MTNVSILHHHSVFHWEKSAQRKLLVIYVDKIVITIDDKEEIDSLKSFLMQKFETKDLENLWYFLSIEVAPSTKSIFMSQRKYEMDFFSRNMVI